MIPFEVLFFSTNLEHVVHNNCNKLTDKEKGELAVKFDKEVNNDPNLFASTFVITGLKTWDNYRDSYNGIKTYKGRACNVNILISELLST